MFDIDRLLGGHEPPFLHPPTPNPCSATAAYDAHVPEQKLKAWKVTLPLPKDECFVPKWQNIVPVTTHHSMHGPAPKGCQSSHRPPSNKSLQSICILCRWVGIFPIWHQNNLIFLWQVGKKKSTSSAFWSILKHLGMLSQRCHSVPQEWQNQHEPGTTQGLSPTANKMTNKSRITQERNR